MKPYYEDDAVTIYCGDSREVLAGLAGHAVVTDPPYGVGFKSAEWDNEIPGWWLDLAMASAPTVAFTTGPTTLWDYPRPDWLCCWYRPASCARSKVGGFSHWAPVLVYGKAAFPVDSINLHAIKHAAPSWITHPSPKPLPLMAWMVEGTTAPGDLVLDPFMGSGTTLRAAKDLGRKAIGVELDERYCELAARRMAQEVLDFGGAP